MTTAVRLDPKDNQIAYVMGSGHHEATAWLEVTESHVRHARNAGKRIAWCVSDCGNTTHVHVGGIKMLKSTTPIKTGHSWYGW